MENSKKKRFKKIYVFAVFSGAVLVTFGLVLWVSLLFLYKPKGYEPPKAITDKAVSRYLTHDLSPRLYNGVQLKEPFELVVVEDGINDIVARAGWPRQVEGVSFLVPEVSFLHKNIVLMGTVALNGTELIYRVVVRPVINEDGLLNLNVTGVKIGAVNITHFARIIASGMYQRQVGASRIDRDDLGAQIAGSLLDDVPFEPVFKIGNSMVRVEKVTVRDKEVVLRMVPI